MVLAYAACKQEQEAHCFLHYRRSDNRIAGIIELRTFLGLFTRFHVLTNDKKLSDISFKFFGAPNMAIDLIDTDKQSAGNIALIN
jgi:hypothetical protein